MGKNRGGKKPAKDGQEPVESELLTEIRTMMETLEQEAETELEEGDGVPESVAEVEVYLDEALTALQEHLRARSYLLEEDIYSARVWHFVQAMSRLSWLQQLAVQGAMLPAEEDETRAVPDVQPVVNAQPVPEVLTLWSPFVKPWEVN